MSGRKVVTPSFEIIRNGGVLKVVPVRKAKLIVGSDPGVDLRLKHPAIEGRHLEITVIGGKYLEARNLAGPGRVMCGGSGVETRRLRRGDVLDLGPVALRLTYASGGKTSKPVPQAERAAPLPVAEEGPTDSDAPAPFRASPPTEELPALRPAGRAPFQDDPEDGTRQITDAPTQTMRALPHERDDAPTQAMAAIARPPATPLPEPPQDPSGSPLAPEPGLEGFILDPVPVMTVAPRAAGSLQIPLRVGTFVIGSGNCALRIAKPGIAPAHAALIVMPDGAVYVRHHGGPEVRTLLNDQAIAYARWSPGDVLTVGPVEMALGLAPCTLGAPVPSLTRLPAVPSVRSYEPLEAVPARTPRDEETNGDVAAPFGALFPHSGAGFPAVPDEPPTYVPAPPQPDEPVSQAPVAAVPSSVPSMPAIPSTPDPAPEPPLIQVRRETTPPAAPVRAPGPAQDYIVDDDLLVEYRAPLWQRAAVPAIVAALLCVIAFQFWAFNRKDEAQRSSGPRVAQGQAPDRDGMQVNMAGGGKMVVGDPRRGGGSGNGRNGQPIEYLGAGQSGGYGGASGYIDPANDWDPGTKSRTVRTAGQGGAGDLGGTRTKTAVDANANVVMDAEARAQRDADRAADAAEAREVQERAPRTTSAGGWVEMSDVEAVIYQNRKKLSYCFSQARESNPRLAGIMFLTLTLGTDGRIRKANLESRSTIGDSGLHQCLRRQLSAMAMPVPEGGPVTFSYPFEMTQ